MNGSKCVMLFALLHISLSPENSRIFSYNSFKARASKCHSGTMQSSTLGLMMALGCLRKSELLPSASASKY